MSRSVHQRSCDPGGELELLLGGSNIPPLQIDKLQSAPPQLVPVPLWYTAVAPVGKCIREEFFGAILILFIYQYTKNVLFFYLNLVDLPTSLNVVNVNSKNWSYNNRIWTIPVIFTRNTSLLLICITGFPKQNSFIWNSFNDSSLVLFCLFEFKFY